MNLAKASDLRRIAFCFISLLLVLVLAWRQIMENWDTWFHWAVDKPTVSPVLEERHVFQDDIQIAEVDPNCGIYEACSEDSFPLHLSTGQPEERAPHLCINGKVVLQRDVNGGGRGLNAAVVEPVQFQVVSVRNFDTYRHDSAGDMDIWLEDIVTNDIVIVFTTDEASAKLNYSTKALLNSMGSGKVQDLSFRAQWFIVTQKGTRGFTTIEQISFPRKKSWGDRLEYRGCVPRIVPKREHTVDPPPHQNLERSRFCLDKTDDIYQALCTQSRFENMMPALLTNRSLIGNRVFSVPIYVFAGEEFEVLLATLDSLLHQPGILIPAVNVVYNETHQDIKDLLKLFGMTGITSPHSMTWQEMITFARKDTATLHPSQSYVIVIAPNTIPSPDFLFYFAQTSFALFRDSSLSAVSAWSPNCYNSPGDVHLAFRANSPAKYGALFTVRDTGGDVIVPDVSRVQGPEACHPPSGKSDNWIERPQDLVQDRYFHKLVMLQQKSQIVGLPQLLNECIFYNFGENMNYVLYFDQDQATLKKVLGCLGIVGESVGEYQKIMRVTVASTSFLMIVTKKSTFYKARPIAVNKSIESKNGA